MYRTYEDLKMRVKVGLQATVLFGGMLLLMGVSIYGYMHAMFPQLF